jgi:hypothetical protein
VGSWNGGGGVEGVLEQWRRCQHGGDSGGGGGGGDGVPVEVVCEGNKKLLSNSGQKAGPEFIG